MTGLDSDNWMIVDFGMYVTPQVHVVLNFLILPTAILLHSIPGRFNCNSLVFAGDPRKIRTRKIMVFGS